MEKKKQLAIQGELLDYLQRRAIRNKTTVEAALDHVILEAMRFDNLVTSIQDRSGLEKSLRH